MKVSVRIPKPENGIVLLGPGGVVPKYHHHVGDGKRAGDVAQNCHVCLLLFVLLTCLILTNSVKERRPQAMCCERYSPGTGYPGHGYPLFQKDSQNR